MVFGFLKKRRQGPVVPSTCSRRVEAFWRWFAEHEQDVYDGLRHGNLDSGPLSAAIDAIHPSLSWELCPSPEDGREGIAFSGASAVPLRLLARYIARRAPPLRRFTVFSSKQPSAGVTGIRTALDGGAPLPLADLRFGVAFDDDAQRVEITAHHPAFPSMPERLRMQLTFCALDAALGENLVEAWVGSIATTSEPIESQRHDADAIRRQVHAALSLHDLDPELDPTDRDETYRNNEVGDGDLVARADVLVGWTRNLQLLRSLRNPDAEDELAPGGACSAYVMFPNDRLTPGQEVEQRAEVTDAIHDRLAADGTGELIGEALGQQYAYIDLVLWDEHAAIRTIREVLADRDIVARASLRYVVGDRRDVPVSVKP